MTEAIKGTQYYNGGSALKRWWDSRNFIQQRMIRFCFTMLVMVLCFPLYYLGLFGSVEGPLNPAHIGERLAGMGVTRTHAMIMFLTFLIVSVAWNWIYNLVSMLIGSRLTCKRLVAEEQFCGARVTRTRVRHKKTGQMVVQYVCSNGHKRPDAHFHPLKKGTVSHSIWVISLAFCIIVFFMS